MIIEDHLVTTQEYFNDWIRVYSRYWTGVEGIPTWKAFALQCPLPDIVLTRSDWWSICTTQENIQSAMALWPGQWIRQINIKYRFEKEDFYSHGY